GYLLGKHRSSCWNGTVRGHWNKYAVRWKKFASPLVIYTLYGSLVAGFDIYLIQRFYGSTEQAFFSLALKWGSLVLVFTTALLSIYWRELAHAIAQQRYSRAAEIYL